MNAIRHVAAATLAVAISLPVAAQSVDHARRNQFSLQYAHGVMKDDDRQFGSLGYDHWFDNGLGLGLSAGSGDAVRNQVGSGLYWAARAEWRMADTTAAIKPRIGLEYGITSTILYSGTRLPGGFIGASFDVSDRLSIDADFWAGRAYYKSEFVGTVVSTTDNLRMLRVGLAYRF